MKNFDEWNTKKKEIDIKDNFMHPKVREVWWCSIGVNVGKEIYGKGTDYRRPVLIVNSEDADNFIGVPLSSKLKNRKYSKIIRTEDGILHSALIYQIKVFDKRRLIKRKSSLSIEEFIEVQKMFENIVQNKTTPFGDVGSIEQRGPIPLQEI